MPKFPKDNKDDKETRDDDWEAKQNLFGLFSSLLEVDKRVNPHLYKKEKEVL